MNYNDVMCVFQTTLHKRKQHDWNWLAVAADDVEESNDVYTARYFRWLAEAQVFPHEVNYSGNSRVGFRWYECTMVATTLLRLSLPLHACVPGAFFEQIRLRFEQNDTGLHRTWWEAFDALYTAYIAQRYIGRCPTRSLKCTFCGLVQDRKPPASAVLIEDVVECWHCERYFQANELP